MGLNRYHRDTHTRARSASKGCHSTCLRCGLVVLFMVLSSTLGAEELRLDARQLWEKAVTHDVRLLDNGTAIELERGKLYEDDGPAAGYSYKPNEDRLSDDVWIKKELMIPNPRAHKATLLVGPGGTLQAIINSQPQTLKDPGKAGNYWQTYTLPPNTFKPGKNEIVLYGSGKVWIARAEEFVSGSRTRTSHPNRSARSTDGGKTWDYDRLGSGANVDGEYYVRVFLDQHRPRGRLTLPVLDAGNLAGQAVGPPLASIGPVRIQVETENGSAGRVTVRVRSGTTFVPTEKNWSDWQDLTETGMLAKPAGRYFQVELELATNDPLQTPRLQQVVIQTDSRPASDWTNKLKVLEKHSQSLVRSSIPFAYEPFDQPQLKTLREKCKLDEVVEGARGEFDLIIRLAAWSAKQWSKGHLKDGYPPWNALEILKSHRDGTPIGGFCQQYNLVFLQACESFGIPGRAVSLGPGDGGAAIRGGHEVVEIWSNDYRKWVYVDGNAAWYAVDAKTKAPLSLWELRQRQLATLKGKPAPAIKVVTLAETRYTWKGLDSWPPFLELRLIPRSNFLQEPSPLPLNQGMRGWFWTGHHVWTDELLPASLLYDHRVGKRDNWEWTLNQVQMVLEATNTPGVLRVHLDTVTPGFETFLADWGKGKGPVSSGFLWTLEKGKNRLEVQPRNRAGREGIASWIVLEYE